MSVPDSRPSFGRTMALALGALGVVYGDIGTSPLYAMRASVTAAGGEMPGALAVYGALSLIFWSLVIVVTVKYVFFILRADNHGEGGVMALAALAHRAPVSRSAKTLIGLAALLGLALFYGDGMLTPAISVLSALEGIGVQNAAFHPFVLPLALAILIGLFAVQKHGTHRIGRFFGPIILVWFAALALLGAAAIIKAPQILGAVNPMHAVALFAAAPWTGFLTMGAVVLAVTGCEALYADMGHFGARAIRWGWLFVACPALMLNYFGQGAHLLLRPQDAPILFYALVPGWAHWPMVLLATMATIIASQAVISGVYSITRQAVQLGQLPRMLVKHTSATEQGQIYVPRINAFLCVGVVLIVLIFKSSDALATAYGIAVTGVMVISTLLVGVVAVHRWHWKPLAVWALFGTLGLVDVLFLASNGLKIAEGGWLPLVVAALVFMVMDTWRVGRRVHMEKLRDNALDIQLFLPRIEKIGQRVQGTAVFLTPRTDIAPNALLHSLKHYHVLHERVVLCSVQVCDTPFVPEHRRIAVENLGKGLFEARITFGFFETPDVPGALDLARGKGLSLEPQDTTYFLGRETLVAGEHPRLTGWRTGLYMWLAGNALSPTRFYSLPPGRVVELGTQVSI